MDDRDGAESTEKFFSDLSSFYNLATIFRLWLEGGYLSRGYQSFLEQTTSIPLSHHQRPKRTSDYRYVEWREKLFGRFVFAVDLKRHASPSCLGPSCTPDKCERSRNEKATHTEKGEKGT